MVRSGRRLTWFLVLYLLLTAVMAWRLVGVQVVSASEYRALADAQLQRDLELPPRRGRLYDRSGEPLALSLPAATIYANPRVLAEAEIDPTFIAAALAPVVGRPMAALMEQLTKDAAFVFLARQLPREVGDQVTGLALPGVGVLEETRRIYPAGRLAAQVVGFAGVDNTGLSGLELVYDDILAGQPGRLRMEQAPGGLTINAAPREVFPAVPGADLVLTIDRQIQYATEQALLDALERYDAIGGSAVVLDARTGEILAMASVPSYSPDDISQASGYMQRNRTVTDVFEPGSVNKVITAAAALEEGLVYPEEVFLVPDHYQVGAKRFRDSSPHPTWELTFAEIMAASSNVGTIQVAQRVGEERLDAYMRRFGYGQTTGLAFPGESAGLLPAVEDWSATSLPTMSIGQGVSTTLLQVAGVFQTIATGGEWVEPTLVRGTVGPDGTLEEAPVPVRRRVLSEHTAEVVAQLLVGVVASELGTGALASVPGYHVAGKTGTAQKPSETERGYQEDAFIASFAGFAPADDPALVIAVMLDEPTPIYGGLTAAPVFREIMAFALGHLRVPPSEDSPFLP